MTEVTRKTVVVGKVGAAYGIKGWVKIISFTEPPESIFAYQPWQLMLGKHRKEITVIASKNNSNHFIAQLPNCNDPETAKQYTNVEIAVYRDQLPKLSSKEFYWTDLEGMTVLTQDNQPLGKVDHILATGANDVLVIEGEKRHLIPFLLDRVILEVNLETRTIRVDWDPDF